MLREIVEQYVETGEPSAAAPLSRRLPMTLSPATIRNVMADLTDAGLLFAPHTSAGRLPTERGLRLFVDGLLQFGELAEEEREAISAALAASGRSLEDTLAEAGSLLSGLSAAAGLVLAPKSEGAAAAHRVRSARARPRPGDPGQRRRARGKPGDRNAAWPAAVGAAAGQQLSQRAPCRPPAGRTARASSPRKWLPTARSWMQLSSQVVEAGLATWTGEGRGGSLIVRGQARLLSDVTQIERLAAIQALFERLETQETMLRLLDLAEHSEGVRIFIGAESGLFGHLGRLDGRGAGAQRGRPHCRAPSG